MALGTGGGSGRSSTHAGSIATSPYAPATAAALVTTAPPWSLPQDPGVDIADAGLSAAPSETTTVHYHAHVDISVNGAPVNVPAGIGFVTQNGRPSGLTSVHTHDASGVVHIEAPADKPYTLGEFFTEWGVMVGPGRLGGLATGGGNALRVFVNGRPFTGDPGTIVFKPHQEIAIWYGPANATPNVPSHYSFSNGL